MSRPRAPAIKATPRTKSNRKSKSAPLEKSRAPTASVAAPQIETPKGLVYVTDESPGISRVKRGDAFGYRHMGARFLSAKRDEPHLTRIRRLAIPPAYTKVWICPSPNGH